MPDGSIIAVIHAKGTSERLPGKALLNLGGKPLIAWAIIAAKQANLVSEVIIDSDDDTILSTGEKYGGTRLKRHRKLATNKTTGNDLAWWQASCFPESKAIVQVVPTCPFTTPQTIDLAIEGLFAMDVNTVVAVRQQSLYIWRGGRPDYDVDKLPNSQNVLKTMWETTGLYAMKTKFILRHKKRIDPKTCLGIEVSQIEAINIDTQEDLDFARTVINGVHYGRSQAIRDGNSSGNHQTLPGG